MITATKLQDAEIDDEGIRPVVLRLHEPIETIVANNPDWKVERTAEGETIFMSPTGGESGIRNSDLIVQLGSWSRQAGGVVFDSSTLFRLPNGALRSPDASWIASDRWLKLTTEERESYPPIAPDFVIELRSRTDRLADLKGKMQEYISAGVRLGWLIDPLQKRIHIFKPNEPATIMADLKMISDDSVLSGFALDLSRIFG